MKTALEILAEVPEGSFVPGVKYYPFGDFITYFMVDEEAVAQTIDRHVVIYCNPAGKIVGLRLNQIGELKENHTLTFQKPFYEPCTDSFIFYLRNVRSFERQISKHLTLFLANDDESLVGFELSGLNRSMV